MFKQLVGKEALPRSLSTILVCLAIFFLVGCQSNYTLTGSTTNTGQGTPASTPTVVPTPTSVPPTAPPIQTPTTVAVPFQVTSIDMAVQPKSVAGMSCGTQVTVTYTATFHIPANSPGGTLHFDYTVNNGRAITPTTVDVSPGQTIATYAFSWSGKLPDDHTYPEPGGVIMTSPGSMISPSVYPTGMCV